MLAVAQAMPSSQTGLAAISRARPSSARMTHAAPSAFAQQSYTCSGEATGSDASAFSNVISFRNRALGFSAP